ncbi:MAG TPA: LuxR C-terminal-related transcriptional regulator [Humisphaera sp.]|nr:LuxR C-terminal-related transcriptional regulator [Humisphaera sp.]
MARSQRLRLSDLRRVFDLVGEVVEIGRDPTAWRTHALRGAVKLTGGRVGLSMDMCGTAPGQQPMLVDPLDVGWEGDEASRRRYYAYHESGEIREDPSAQAYFQQIQRTPLLSVLRGQLVDDQTWYASPTVSEARRSGNVDDFICSSCAIAPGALQGFILYRAWGAPYFEVRQRRLLRYFHLSLLRALRKSEALQHAPVELVDLPPRVEQTLELLLAGHSMKQVAYTLGLSPHTVNDYMKILYRRAGVNSRAELLGKYLGRGLYHRLLLPQPLMAVSHFMDQRGDSSVH